MAPPSEARRDRGLLAAWVVAAFALSAVTDPRSLGVAWALALLLFRRGALRAGRRLAVTVLPLTGGVAAASWGWVRITTGTAPPLAPLVALVLRAVLIAFVTLSVLARVDLLRALAPWPAATRLLVITLAQIHSLRLLATESLLGLRSRLPRRPGALDVLRGAGGTTAALFTLQARNAREISDALRARGF